jgi:hypothetical protein
MNSPQTSNAQGLTPPRLGTVLALVAVLVAIFFVGRCTAEDSFIPPPTIYKTDTIRINKILRDTVKIVVQAKAETITIYKADTVRRKQIESGTIVSGVRTSKGKLQVETINPKGETQIASYPLPDHSDVQITARGEVQITPTKPPKKPRRGIWLVVGVGLGLIVANAVR